ncbi:MAG: TIGR02206 family membrane protein [Candidatus Dormibacteraeota bacterium]|nr:TIGR02206 family membrane protein [Candidatus Dormibacteraeota bacterium]
MDLLTYVVPIVVVGFAAVAAGWLPHRYPEWPWRLVGVCLAAMLVICEASWWVKLLTTRPFHLAADLPLQLCDLTVWVAAAALVFRREILLQLTWLWGVGGGIPALFLPVRGAPFPGWFYFEFYLAHGGIIVAGLLAVVAFGMRIRFSSMVRALVITGALALAVGSFDVVTGGDYLYLTSLPAVAGALQALSSWPLYRVALCSAAALVLIGLGWVARERGTAELAPAAAPTQTG